MANINAGPFTTRPEIDGTFGVVASTHWIGTAVGMGDAGARRQRLRCRHRHGLHAAGGGAAPVRSRRRRAGDALRRERHGKPDRRVRPGPGAGRRHHRALSRPSRARHHAGHRPAAGLRAGHVRDLHADPARLRHHAPARRAGAGHRLRAQRPSAGRARLRHHRHRRRALPRALADLGRRLSAGRQGARARTRCSPTSGTPRPTSAS